MTTFCTSCGTALGTDQSFCTGCGSPTVPPASPYVPAESPPPTPYSSAASGWDTVTGSTGPDVGWRPQEPARRGRPWLVPLAVLLVVLLAGGVGLRMAFGRTGSSPSTALPAPTSDAIAPDTDVSGAADPAVTDTAADSPTVDMSTTTAGPADPDTVQLSAEVSSPAAATVVSLMQRHFTAVNALDYATYATTMLRPSSGGSFSTGYRSVHDSQVTIASIDPTGADSVAVGLSFVSTQDLDQAPPTLRVPRICWQQQLPVTQLSAGGRIGSPPAGSTTMRAC